MSISVATLGISTWELVDRLERLHGEVTVVRRCMDLSELLACSHTGMADVALVAEGAEELTGSLLEQLGGNGVRVLVVEGHESSRLSRLGDPSVPASATGEELAERVQLALRGPAGAGTDARTGGATSSTSRNPADNSASDRSAHDDAAHDDAAARDQASAREGASARDHTAGPGRAVEHDDAAGAPGARRAPDESAPAASSPAERGARGGRGHRGRKDSSSAATPKKKARVGAAARSATDDLGKGAREHTDENAGENAWQPDAHAESTATTTGAAADGSGARGLVSVWGPAGSPGRTVTAVNLAAEAALLGVRVLLVDADTYAASVAASLGMLDEAAGLAQACRLADQGRMDASGLRRCVTAVSVAGASVDVLTGITRHDRWPEIRGSALESVLARARQDYDLVVVDTASCLEADEEITTDFLAPRRNAAALGAVAASDTVIALGAADALGVPRLVKALPDLWEAAPEARVLVVMNKLRYAAAGRSAGDAVREAWDRFSPGHPVEHTLPWDPGACDDALLAGAVLAETAPRSALRAELSVLVRLLERTDEEPGAQRPAVTVRGTRLGRRMGAWLRRG